MMSSEAEHVCMTSATITLRNATDADSSAVVRLSRLDSRQPREDRYLIAEAGGQPLAAIALSDGLVIADPFQPTAGAVELLRSRREQILIARQHPHARRRRMPRLRSRHTAARAA
jgi:hypothetical protein